jgi:hypothetical protein
VRLHSIPVVCVHACCPGARCQAGRRNLLDVRWKAFGTSSSACRRHFRMSSILQSLRLGHAAPDGRADPDRRLPTARRVEATSRRASCRSMVGSCPLVSSGRALRAKVHSHSTDKGRAYTARARATPSWTTRRAGAQEAVSKQRVTPSAICTQPSR